MRVIARSTLTAYGAANPRADQALRAWYAEAKQTSWSTPADTQAKYRHASILKDGRVVFNICGNEFRLVVWIHYEFATILIKFIGTHTEYDKIDAQTVQND